MAHFNAYAPENAHSIALVVEQMSRLASHVSRIRKENSTHWLYFNTVTKRYKFELIDPNQNMQFAAVYGWFTQYQYEEYWSCAVNHLNG